MTLYLVDPRDWPYALNLKMLGVGTASGLLRVSIRSSRV